GDQGDADQQQEGQRQHLGRRVPADEVADRGGGEHHHRDGDDYGGDHDRQVVGHADGGDHRVERENHVDHEDLHDRRGEGGGLAAVRALVPALDGAVDLRSRLGEQEQPAGQQDDVAPGDREVEDLEQRRGQLGEPHETRQQHEAADQREAEAEALGEQAAVLRDALGDDRQEDDVVDPEHDLEKGEGQQAGPDGGIGNPLEHRPAPETQSSPG